MLINTLRFRCLIVAVSMAACAISAFAGFSIEWGGQISLGDGAYARVHKLKDGRYMAAYSKGADLMVRFSKRNDIRKWSEPQRAAKHFYAGEGEGKIKVILANAEFAQLQTGRIILATNLRPQNWRHDIFPCSIGIVTSDDGGASWSALDVIYKPMVDMPADGKPHGCYEPFVLPLNGANAQIYFADETPYVNAKCSWQNISYIETANAGKSWTGPKIAAYTPKRRDGMPALLDVGKWRYLAIETNPGKTRLHPQLLTCRKLGAWESAARFEPLASPPDWHKSYGGAPYLAATVNYILLVWQESSLAGDPLATSVARVAAVPKKEILPNGQFSTMRGESTPPGPADADRRMLWNSLCSTGADSFVLVSEVNGKIILYPGKIKRK